MMAHSGWWYFSDIPADRMWRWHADYGLQLFRSPSHHANGNCIRDGHLLTCEHKMRRVSSTNLQEEAKHPCPSGKDQTDDAPGYSVIASQFEGKVLNSPNDVIIHSSGTIWFTDPDYGVVAKMGHGNPIEQAHNHVFCFNPATGDLTSVSHAERRPNGLCFDPLEIYLYVADSGAWFQRIWQDSEPHHVVRYNVEADGTLSHRQVIVHLEKEAGGIPDGLRCDSLGNIYVATLEGVHIYTSAGGLLAKIRTPETTANMSFGGKDGKTLLLTATSCIWLVEMNIEGAGVVSGDAKK